MSTTFNKFYLRNIKNLHLITINSTLFFSFTFLDFSLKHLFNTNKIFKGILHFILYLCHDISFKYLYQTEERKHKNNLIFSICVIFPLNVISILLENHALNQMFKEDVISLCYLYFLCCILHGNRSNLRIISP